MSIMRVTWNSDKAKLNQVKHGASFEEAQTVFYDDYAQLINDPDHSENEERFILLGRSNNLRLIIVCHCYRESDSVIRIFSARKATAYEQALYTG